jgi:hypothetical protein
VLDATQDRVVAALLIARGEVPLYRYTTGGDSGVDQALPVYNRW